VKNEPQIGRRPIKESFMFEIKICEKMSPKSVKGLLQGVLCFNSNLWKNKPQIGRKPIKGRFMFKLKFVKNEPQIGRRPIKESFMFLIKICEKMSPKSAGGRLKGV
jgi:hypothetical protein